MPLCKQPARTGQRPESTGHPRHRVGRLLAVNRNCAVAVVRRGAPRATASRSVTALSCCQATSMRHGAVALARRKPPARSDAECADVVIGRARL
jgi:hypothetical protein